MQLISHVLDLDCALQCMAIWLSIYRARHSYVEASAAVGRKVAPSWHTFRLKYITPFWMPRSDNDGFLRSLSCSQPVLNPGVADD
jgi:hypothetical protein